MTAPTQLRFDGSRMPLIQRRRPLRRSAIVGVARQAPGRIEALAKLKGLLDSGVLTEEQYEAERQKLLRER